MTKKTSRLNEVKLKKKTNKKIRKMVKRKEVGYIVKPSKITKYKMVEF
jgi:hypothetical protein